MPKTVPAEIRVAGLPQMQRFIGSVTALIQALVRDAGNLPATVVLALGQLQRDLDALGGSEAGPVPSDEDRIRDAMAEAREHPGRVVTR